VQIDDGIAADENLREADGAMSRAAALFIESNALGVRNLDV